MLFDCTIEAWYGAVPEIFGTAKLEFQHCTTITVISSLERLPGIVDRDWSDHYQVVACRHRFPGTPAKTHGLETRKIISAANPPVWYVVWYHSSCSNKRRNLHQQEREYPSFANKKRDQVYRLRRGILSKRDKTPAST